MRRLMLAASFVAVVLFLTAANAQNVYFGNLHSHTSFSDGTGTPEEAFDHARAAGLHFLAITEHNHIKADGTGDRKDGITIANEPERYTGPRRDALIPVAERKTENGRFVAIYGQEYSTISSGNHVNVFDVPKVIDVPNGQFDELLKFLDSNRDTKGDVPPIQFNHPGLFPTAAKEYGRHNFASAEEWVAALKPHVKLIEVLNGPAMTKTDGNRSSAVQEKDYFHYLNLGFNLAPSTGQDNHYRTWGTATDARVAVLADTLTKDSILAALKNRRAYATEDKNLEIIFRVNGRLMGDIVTTLPQAGEELDIRVSLKDEDEPNAHYRVEVYSDVPGGQPAKDPVDTFEIEGDTPTPVKLEGVRFQESGQYVFLKIIQTPEEGDRDRAWTAPVWFATAAAPPPPPVAGSKVRMVRLVPNPAGPDEQNESVTLRNTGTDAVSLTGWALRDAAGAQWTLDGLGTLTGGQEKTIKRNGQPMSLNNNGDTIELVNQSGRTVQTVNYGAVGEDQVVTP